VYADGIAASRPLSLVLRTYTPCEEVTVLGRPRQRPQGARTRGGPDQRRARGLDREELHEPIRPSAACHAEVTATIGR
jgi:hypothetical protein